MELDALAALTQALVEGGGTVVLLWLLVREQQRHDTLIRVIVERSAPKSDEPNE